ncbi:Hsp20/alpha crystallin family protein [Rubripirellula reticaptiva]|uniref:Spore protein SP21 n=1 Tax=Rubripirellula reticaptiva TaxID=2528013 RepID=A0A5C6EHE3_9BACT|nr:Hsp20/alpha crystallin family protein [Rubripirellula reticaptiva]TWU46679.1 Spore protein SP21 [Rubripirellula reticaptiva]
MFKNLIPRKRQSDSGLMEVDPKNEMAQFRANFDRMLNDVWRGNWDDAWNNGWGCDVKDAEDEIVVRAEAPGFEPDEIDVRLSAGRLVMQAEHRAEQHTTENGDGQFSSYGKFYRAMSVPAGIEADKIEARYKNGVLEVHLPKGEEAKSKRIAVQAK